MHAPHPAVGGAQLMPMRLCRSNQRQLQVVPHHLPPPSAGTKLQPAHTCPLALRSRRNTMVASEPRRTGSSRSASARSSGWADRSLLGRWRRQQYGAGQAGRAWAAGGR